MKKNLRSASRGGGTKAQQKEDGASRSPAKRKAAKGKGPEQKEESTARGRSMKQKTSKKDAKGSKSKSNAKKGKEKATKSVTPLSPVEDNAKPKKRGAKKSASPDQAQKDVGNALFDDQSDDVAFEAGTYVAYLDINQDSPDTFRLGLLLESVKENDKELQVDEFIPQKEPLHFKRELEAQLITDLSVVQAVDVTVVKPTRKSKKAPEIVKITKQQATQVAKMAPRVWQRLEEQEAGSSEDEADQNDSDSDNEIQVDSAEKIQARRIVKVKGKQIDSLPKKKPTKASKPKAKPAGKGSKLKVPEFGKKRRRGASDLEEDEDEDEDMVGSNAEDEADAPQKRRKVGTGKNAKVEAVKQPKAKKVPPKPTVFKKGKWNPDIELIEYDKATESNDMKLIDGCCTRCNNRNVHRAAMTGNLELLKKCINDKMIVTNLNAYWSPEVKKTPIEILVENGDAKLLGALLRPNLKVLPSSTYSNTLDQLLFHRGYDDRYLMQMVDSGRVGHMAYGAHVRSVQMTRGNRQGNNAFLQYQDANKNPISFLQDVQRCLQQRILSVETFQLLEKLRGGGDTSGFYDFKQGMSYSIHEAVRVGDYKLTSYVIKDLYQHSNYGYNELHYNVLQDYRKGAKLPEFKSVNVQKKAHMNRGATPLHFACINPNVEVLSQLLDVNPDFNMQDTDMRRPVHYAAASENSDALKLLVEKGANLADIDTIKTTCLHVAALARRPDNIRFILSKNPALLKLRDKRGKTAMAFACEHGDLESIKALIEHGAGVNQGAGAERMQPLAWAAALGLYDVCEWLLDNKARVLGKDKFKRCPLALAVRNGHLKVASLLLQRGAEWDQPDSSSNTPLHYAAAYGWPDCIDLLLKAGADINAENSWRITPINIAMQKNHEGCVKKFLEYEAVDVNGKDEKGRTLLTLAMLDLTDRTIDFVRYLLDKGADPNIADIEEQTALHYLVQLRFDNQWHLAPTQELQNALKKRRKQQVLELADLLLNRGASLTKVDAQKRTPFALCLEQSNTDLLEKLIDGVTLNKDTNLLHIFSSKILDTRYQEILRRLIENEKPTSETLEVLNDNGLTPFLACIQQFSSQYQTLSGQMLQLVNAKAGIHGADFKAYKIDNQSLFTSQGDTRAFNVVQNAVSGEKRSELTTTLMDQHVVQPFLKCLKLLVQQGADPHAIVKKLKYYRELDEEKRKKALVKEAAQAAQANGQIVSKKEEVAKKREEVMKEREASKTRAKSAKKKVAKRGVAYGQQTTEKQVDVEYHATLGLQNAFHVAVASPHSRLIEYLVDLKVNPDLQDRKGLTPFNLASTTPPQTPNLLPDLVMTLISLGVRTDLADAKGRTPFLNYYGASRFQEAEHMLGLGAYVNQRDSSGLYALKYALIRRDGPAIDKLVKQYKADVNLVDLNGRNLLHHAINMSSATADASFETEQQLIDLGININHRDQRERTPLHYAFVKIKDWRNIQQIDPIETVSSLCGCQGLEIEVQDKWQRTPLHYAAQRGAAICAMYLEKRGARLETKDIYGNTPLGVALLAHHHNFGIFLIQKSADIHQLVHQEDPERIARMWKEEEDKQKKQAKGDEEMREDSASEEESDDGGKAKHRRLFEQHRDRNESSDDSGSDAYGEESSDEDSDDQYEQQVFNQQNAFNNTVFGKAPRAVRAVYGGGFQFNNNQGLYGQGQDQEKEATSQTAKKEPESMFRVAIKHQQLGLAYMILDQGYHLMHAIQDALDEKKFQLVLTLLAKVPDDAVVQRQNQKGQNLFHVLCQNSQGCQPELQKRIFGALQKRGVKCILKDGFSRTPLHYAVESASKNLVDLLLENNSDPKDVDMYGHSPLTLYMKGQNAKRLSNSVGFQVFDPNTAAHLDHIFLALAKRGANMNHIYPETEFKPAYKDGSNDQMQIDSKDVESQDPYICTILINLVRQMASAKEEDDQKKLHQGIMGLLQYGARLNAVDSDGRDAMAYAVMNNNVALVELFIKNSQVGHLNKQLQDKQGKSIAHFVINPIPFGSYENSKLLEILSQAGYSLQLRDSSRKEPIHYAAEQQSGVLLKSLMGLTKRSKAPESLARQSTTVSSDNWPKPKVDYREDSAEFLQSAQEREEKELENQDKMKELAPVDKAGQFEKSYAVYCEGKQPWDAYLTKVDLRNGVYGDYVFYKLQLLHDSVRDLYVVFTRWGRIGETGMNQRTPFNNLEEAKKEFCSIFKSKSGNDFTDLDNFKAVEKKYVITKVNYATVAHQDYLAPFDYDKCCKSVLDKNVKELIEEVSNVTMYQKAMNQLGLDRDMLPISGVTKETIDKAKEILREIGEKVEEDQKIARQGMQADLTALSAIRDKISELSSRYYELIPLERYKDQIAPRLANAAVLKQRFDELDALTNIEQASKVLLGALYRQVEMHPIDYIHHALNLMIDYVDPKGAEHQLLETFVKNTAEGSVNFTTHRVKFFKIQRKGEAESIEAFKDVPNRRLLFHGSSMFNFIGILLQGMKIAPPEAPSTGQMFGKGVYLADMFSKSFQYSQGRFVRGGGDSTLLLLCETVLGESKKLWRSEQVTKLSPPHHSVRGVGRIGPDYRDSVIMPNGVEVPCGPQIEYKDYEPEAASNANQGGAFGGGFGGFYGGGSQGRVWLGHNEFVVYDTSQIRMRYLVQLVKKTPEELKAERLSRK